MGKVPFNEDIKEQYDEYTAFLAAPKFAQPSIKVMQKKNHQESLMAMDALACENSFDSGVLYIELKNHDRCDFSFQIMGEKTKGRVLFRYDAKPGGAVHKNSVPYIPLIEQQVGHPHFHKFNERGHLLAYKTDILKDQIKSIELSEISNGFPYFCSESHISTKIADRVPALNIVSDSLPIPTNSDPNDGVAFP